MCCKLTLVDCLFCCASFADFLKDDMNWVTGDVNGTCVLSLLRVPLTFSAFLNPGKMVVSSLTSMLFVYYHTAAPIPNESGGSSLALRALRPGSTKVGTRSVVHKQILT